MVGDERDQCEGNRGDAYADNEAAMSAQRLSSSEQRGGRTTQRQSSRCVENLPGVMRRGGIHARTPGRLVGRNTSRIL